MVIQQAPAAAAQPQQAHILQTADGQTYIYQPVQLENPSHLPATSQPTCNFLKTIIFLL